MTKSSVDGPVVVVVVVVCIDSERASCGDELYVLMLDLQSCSL